MQQCLVFTTVPHFKQVAETLDFTNQIQAGFCLSFYMTDAFLLF